MTEKTTRNKGVSINDTDSFKNLSIQVSLNGLSFFVLDSITQKVDAFEQINFKVDTTPYLLQKELKKLLEKNNLDKALFEKVQVVHNNDMFCLVPKPLFDVNELPNYLKFNTKLLANDEIAYDELSHHEITSVYVPFTNINNLIFELYGEFEFIHNSSMVLQSLFNHKIGSKPVCYAHISKTNFELIAFDKKKLLLFNQFQYKTKEDFLYYLLFTYEQLGFDTESVKVKLFGSIEEGDELFNICYQYIKKVAVFEPNTKEIESNPKDSIDLTHLNTFK
ncbi:DUF3822 family protein [Croceitalea vernalis]|uniref:DUF3822 family protein n=1 Tax=Croceitalea vernalis TaxID=3075599 RepID=A0ABU3BKA9_9FLAO|nr:DUF3822 family protein [Croceitalea sp. P007]MDT0622598.1 DUF3822 family protein [Croceitalea sp. P007]